MHRGSTCGKTKITPQAIENREANRTDQEAGTSQRHRTFRPAPTSKLGRGIFLAASHEMRGCVLSEGITYG